MDIEKINIVPGLYYIKNIVKKEKEILDLLDNEDWIPLTDSKNSRLVQHYGFKYDYKTHKINEKTKEIPFFLDKLKNNLIHICKHLNIIDDKYIFNQCIINNYIKKQKITKHRDTKSYGDVICCYSILSKGIMRFTNKDKTFDIETEPNSLYIMSGDARYIWKHEMLSLKSERRISITFRMV